MTQVDTKCGSWSGFWAQVDKTANNLSVFAFIVNARLKQDSGKCKSLQQLIPKQLDFFV